MDEVIDIYSKGEYPASVLSNFYPNGFVFEGVECASMEGFLQSLKFRNPKRQLEVCLLTGGDAKKAGNRKFLWRWTGNVFWQGKRLRRTGEEFSRLVFAAYKAMFEQNEIFRKALLGTKGKKLAHSIGRSDKRKTILTEKEFLDALNGLREFGQGDYL